MLVKSEVELGDMLLSGRLSGPLQIRYAFRQDVMVTVLMQNWTNRKLGTERSRANVILERCGIAVPKDRNSNPAFLGEQAVLYL